MTFESRFTEEEIFLLSSTPVQIGTVMAFAEGSGLGTVKEMLSSSKTYISGLKEYPNNEIIIGVLVPTTGWPGRPTGERHDVNAEHHVDNPRDRQRNRGSRRLQYRCRSGTRTHNHPNAHHRRPWRHVPVGK